MREKPSCFDRVDTAAECKQVESPPYHPPPLALVVLASALAPSDGCFLTVAYVVKNAR